MKKVFAGTPATDTPKRSLGAGGVAAPPIGGSRASLTSGGGVGGVGGADGLTGGRVALSIDSTAEISS
jgi:hypothetical protein